MLQSVQKYNALNGVVSRLQIQELKSALEKDEQTIASKKLETLLNRNPLVENFEIEIVNNIFEQPSKALLSDLEHIPETDDAEGLAKAVSPNEIYQMITDKMLKMIEEASGKGYKKKWKGKIYSKGYTIPFNFESKKRYRGVNVFLLTNFDVIENPFFLTFKQVKKLGGKIKKGSFGKPVVYFTKLYKIEDHDKNIDFGTYDIKKATDFAKKNGIDTDKILYLPILKYYNVFNGKDISGIDFDLDNFKTGYIENELPTTETTNKLSIPEAIIGNYPKPKPKLSFGGDRAFYRGGTSDQIQMPYLLDFDTVQDYYRTLFHEYSHSTGIATRLNRDMKGKFGSKKYAFEELVAEWGAVFLSAEAGIIYHNNTNHAEYIKNWNSALTHIKNDNRFIMRACTEAQKVADYILQFDNEKNPKYLKQIKAISKEDKAKKNIPKVKDKNTVITKKKQTIAPESNVPRTRKKKSRKVIEPISNNGQYRLLGTPKATKRQVRKSTPKSKVKKNVGLQGVENSLLQRKQQQGQQRQFFELLPKHKDLETLLGKVEIQKKESAVMTLSAPQGSGKTTAVFQMMNAFAESGYNTLFASLEEHPDSYLFEKKADQYLTEEAQSRISAPHYSSNNVNTLLKDIKQADVIFIDSMKKLWQYIKGFDLDNDLRKAYDGKLFVIIFQLTSTGKMRGGSDAQFDGDIISFIEKHDNFSENYIYHDKNRYAVVPIHETKFNIVSQSLVGNEATEPTGLKFDVV